MPRRTTPDIGNLILKVEIDLFYPPENSSFQPPSSMPSAVGPSVPERFAFVGFRKAKTSLGSGLSRQRMPTCHVSSLLSFLQALNLLKLVSDVQWNAPASPWRWALWTLFPRGCAGEKWCQESVCPGYARGLGEEG